MTHHVYLVPGFFGFANLGDFRYFGHVRDVLAARCADVGLDVALHAVQTHPTSSLPRRAGRLLETIAATASGDDGPIHLLGHSSGGLDVRLVASPGVRLETAADAERFAARFRTVVTVAAPHHGAPLATLFTSLLGQRLLHVISLATIYVLRFGSVPLSVGLGLAGALARAGRRGAMHPALLDQLFGELLGDFTADRRDAIERFFVDVRGDQSLLPQLAPESMEVFNATTHDRPGVRYGCIVTRARPAGLAGVLAAGLDPQAQATHAIYLALHRLAGRSRRRHITLTTPQADALRRAYGRVPGWRSNDGLVPTLSQVWGEVIDAVEADHLDVIGHFGDPTHVPPHFDWLTSGSGFGRGRFDTLWTAVARYLAGGEVAIGERVPLRHARSLGGTS